MSTQDRVCPRGGIERPKRASVALATVLALAGLAAPGCGGGRASRANPATRTVSAGAPVDASDPMVRRRVGDGSGQIEVWGRGALDEGLRTRQLLKPYDPEAQKALTPHVAPNTITPSKSPAQPGIAGRDSQAAPSLTVAIPLGLLREQYVFGGVITRVSEARNERLGDLKLTDLPPTHATLRLTRSDAGEFQLALVGCLEECREGAALEPFAAFPVLAVDRQSQAVIVDLASIGGDFNLIALIDPLSQHTQLKTTRAQTTAVDYSLATLVFDVETTLEPATPLVATVASSDASGTTPGQPTSAASPAAKTTQFVARWYLRLASRFDPAFEPRPPRPEVGFFLTARGAKPQIERFSRTRVSGEAIHYWIKNVPAEYHPAFRAAIDDWNQALTPVLGTSAISYEFVSGDTEAGRAIVAGDPRYNVIEWDLDNRASYGGLGPVLAHQLTGEIFAAHVLVQGPTIVEIYRAWFEAAERAQALRAQGREREAERLELKTLRELRLRSGRAASPAAGPSARPRLALSLGLAGGKRVDLRVMTERPELEDPLFDSREFEPLPVGQTFATYMQGYFREMVAHEIGHNLGLRHNFKGSLGAEPGETGAVSRSIMDYLSRGYRHRNRIGAYDLMAIAYGYLGQAPTQSQWFCADEDLPSPGARTLSAECSKTDATADPFGYFETRLARSIDLLLARGSDAAPEWQVKDLADKLYETVLGMGFYGTSAKANGAGWVGFWGRPGRPTDTAQVPGYVVGRLRAQLCAPELDQEVLAKGSSQAADLARANLSTLRRSVVGVLAQLGYEPAKVACSSEDLPKPKPPLP